MRPHYTNSVSAISSFFCVIKTYLEMHKSGRSMDVFQKAFVGGALIDFEKNLAVRQNDPLNFDDAYTTEEEFFHELLTLSFSIYKILPKELLDFLDQHLVNASGDLLGQEELIKYLEDFITKEGINDWVIEKINAVDIAVYRKNHFYIRPSYQESEKRRQEIAKEEILHLQDTIFPKF